MESKPETKWVACPDCGSNTRTKLRKDTILFHQLVFCPKCKKEFLVNVNAFDVVVVKEGHRII
ncbi:cysteine-rich KTR domain-containing protein [Frisingicoccus sp.]|uniref:cysteine-rich KTR domain-containing protein n=1 Tax=Frisingicoccus sp. TaxID=1918627 RepID=UPI002E76225F|nr:cysteine-rich KTR domain-containing protein [Frisingicoccus sp.]MEE0751731.1 cysteine-rich KTR domain-containing protein [Frisingicoccus sp.]